MKRVLEIRDGGDPHWVGDGFHVRSMFSYDDGASALSPFLLLDYAAPMEFAPTEERHGVGPHPHRGFETVTIALQGEVEHRDSAGHAGRIGPGDVQWMTAASGVVHEEFHGREFARRGGPFEMVQIWVNLPKRDKMSAPRYQDLAARAFPEVKLAGGAGSVRVIAGEYGGARGPARTFTPIEMWRIALEAGREAELPLPSGHNALLLVTRGDATIGATRVAAGNLAVLAREGDVVALRAGARTEGVLLAGAPIMEPVVGYGPFVMNTREEIAQAVRDLQSGRMGRLEEQ